MTVDQNTCLSCGWEQCGDDVNPRLRKCPDCGARFSNQFVERVFVKRNGGGSE